MLPVFTVLLAGMFQETAIQRVEKVYYPEKAPETVSFWPDIKHDIRFTLWSLFLNILVFPLNFIGIGFIASFALNSYLLGREFFESSAGFHIGKHQAYTLGMKYRTHVYAGGSLIALLSITPVLNLFTPIIAVVWMTHVYHHLPESSNQSSE